MCIFSLPNTLWISPSENFLILKVREFSKQIDIVLFQKKSNKAIWNRVVCLHSVSSQIRSKFIFAMTGKFTMRIKYLHLLLDLGTIISLLAYVHFWVAKYFRPNSEIRLLYLKVFICPDCKSSVCFHISCLFMLFYDN